MILEHFKCELLLYTFNSSSVFPICPRVYWHSLPISSCLMDVDSESSPLPNARELTCADELERLVSRQVRCFGGTVWQCKARCPVAPDPHPELDEEVRDRTRKDLFRFKASTRLTPLQHSLYCLSNYLPMQSATRHLVLD